MNDERYRARWARSGELFARATRSLPGANTRTQLYADPFPLYAARAYGARLELSDGPTLADFLLNYTASALGHSHPAVARAIEQALRLGDSPGLPTESEIVLAEHICARFPGAERVRFTNSGSESTMHALRVARAFTGRTKLAKAEGAYHGSYDSVDIGVTRGWRDGEQPTPETHGAPPELARSTIVFPYNNTPAALEILDAHAHELATVMIEIFLNSAGAIAGDARFLGAIAAWCAANNVLLTIDEVASWRTSYHGAAHDYTLRPDLLCLGKALGGGFPIGVVAGRADVMAEFDPRRPNPVRHAGTFNAHPVTMAAGRAVLDALDEPAIAAMNARCGAITDGIRAIGARHDVPLTATSYGSIGRIHIARTPPTCAPEAFALPKQQRLQLHRALLEHGILIGTEGRFCTCTETTDAQVESLLAALESCAPPLLR
ncbi:MAG TPA: aminotransferase class III-fold pyridoxal phosphate-dependent enzyme [Solirubrobacteraceae bacterium]|nr:aminotransferase class III-fold pyridoxal phosphate-dependent enzyme [Solirubrobacteraceae bacterium]